MKIKIESIYIYIFGTFNKPKEKNIHLCFFLLLRLIILFLFVVSLENKRAVIFFFLIEYVTTIHQYKKRYFCHQTFWRNLVLEKYLKVSFYSAVKLDWDDNRRVWCFSNRKVNDNNKNRFMGDVPALQWVPIRTYSFP